MPFKAKEEHSLQDSSNKPCSGNGCIKLVAAQEVSSYHSLTVKWESSRVQEFATEKRVKDALGEILLSGDGAQHLNFRGDQM